jgi:hypothetical protein
METVLIRDPGWRQFGSGIWDGDSSDPASGMGKSRIRDKYPGSATLYYILKMCVCAGDEYTWLEYARKPSRRDIGSRMLYRDAHMTGWAYKADSATKKFLNTCFACLALYQNFQNFKINNFFYLFGSLTSITGDTVRTKEKVSVSSRRIRFIMYKNGLNCYF